MNALLNFINNPALPWLLALAIIVSALLIWLRFVAALSRLSQQLRQLQTVLADLHRDNFASRYPALDAALSTHPVLGRQWQAFRQTLILPESAIEPAYYTQRPADYFNEQTLVAPFLNLRLYQAVPNILVGVGIWFTFLGLVAALWFASQGVAAADIGEAQRALQDLLHAATFKFITSIAGLLASILFSWAEKSRLYRLHLQINRVCAALESGLLLHTPAQWGALQLAETRRQTAALQAWQTDLPATFSEAIQPLALAITQLGTQLDQGQQAALGQLISSFGRQIQGAAGTELQQLAGTLQQLGASLAQLQRGFAQSGSDFGQQLQLAGHMLTKTQENFAHFGEDWLNRLLGVTQQLVHSASLLEQASAPLDRSATLLSAIPGQFQALAQQLEHSSQALTRSSQSANQALEHSSQRVTQVWQQYQSRFEQVDEDVAQVFQELSSGMQQYRQQVEQFTGRLDESLNTAVRALNGVIGELVEAIEDLRAKPGKGGR